MQPHVYLAVPLFLICHFMNLALANENYLLEFDYRSVRFRQWFPEWKDKLENIGATSCNKTLEDYVKLGFPNDGVGDDDQYRACKAQITCLLEQFSERDKAVMQSVGVLLGLLPAFLS